MLKQVLLGTASCLMLLACGQAEPGANAEAGNQTVGFLAFGDTGYHVDYMDAADFTPPFKTREAFIDMERREWLDDKKPADSFRPSPIYFHEGLGSYVPASGLMPVAAAMKQVCAEKACDFALMLGDNVYPSGAEVDGHDADRFEKVFNQPYADLGGDKPDFKTYVTLGNHDWKTSREGAMAQLEYLSKHPAFYMDGFIYRVKPAGTNGLVELFIVDTELMLGGTTVYKARLNDDGSEAKPKKLDINEPWSQPQTELEKNQAAWLENAMKTSDAKWKILVAHHPVWASGGSKFEQGHALRKILMPVACKYADVYFAGHEHMMEVHEDTCAGTGVDGVSPLPQIVSGAASKQRGANRNFMAYQDRTYPEKITHYVRDMVWGFTRMEVTGDDATVEVYTTPDDSSGKPELAYSFSFKHRSLEAP